MKVGFIVNPIAGLGGPLAFKGTTMEIARKALLMGIKPWAPLRAKKFLEHLKRRNYHDVIFITCGSVMGENELKEIGFSYKVVYNPQEPTTQYDTINGIKAFEAAGVDAIVFVGGDGTAKDVYTAINSRIIVIGVPAGVKMFSGVFAVSPEGAANLLIDYFNGLSNIELAEVLDIDEERYRNGELRVSLIGYMRTIRSQFVQGSKLPTPQDEYEEQVSIAKWFSENIDENAFYIMGPGSTTKVIADYLGIPKTLLGVDVYHGRRIVMLDVDAEFLRNFVKMNLGSKIFIVVSPTGSQGFIFGRGNVQIPSDVIKTIGRDNIIIVATKSKILRTKMFYIDTGDVDVDLSLSGYMRVISGYNEETVIKVRNGYKYE
ncbi:MAG: ATP-NAD kinase family protein [Thermoprotei archaeon]